ncbi:benzoate transport [Acinetobacter marinus]|uniref:Benzoate transport n=1 Tax=Acinetobacter marinus TaxID=281375 RepID=A0A1G6GLH7_9GAMM|nr:MFS transporter [Acinetobacter marinus]SDB82810.1 benzoate transport [Acinetobacter marinus]
MFAHPIKKDIDDLPMTRFQWMVISICLLLYIVDGYDFMVMAYVASSVSAEFALSGTSIGTLISAGIIGMTVGSLFVAPLGDKIGRRNLVLISALICGVSMVAATFAQSFSQLAFARFITGIGIGGIQISCMVLTAEFSAKKVRGFNLALLSAGYGLGATIGGILAAILIESHSWRHVFMFGGVATLILYAAAYVYIPESVDYLLFKQPKKALEKLNAVLKKLHREPIATLPVVESTVQNQSTVKQLFSPRYFAQTICLWIAMFFLLYGFYFVMGWTPKILAQAGLSPQSGVQIGMWVSLGGILGSMTLGLLTTKFKIFHIQTVFLLCVALTIFVFVNLTAQLNLLTLTAIVLGFFLNGCMAGIYTISALVYESDVRSTGVGFATGLGRFGGISSPIIAGYFLDQGVLPLSLYGFYLFIFVIAALGIMVLTKLYYKTNAPLVEKTS